VIDYALEKARQIPYERHKQRVYAVVHNKRGKIFAEGSCLYGRSHPMQKRYSIKAGFDEWRCYLHAETRVIAACKGRGSILTVVRIAADGRALNSAPCPSCSLLISDCGFIKNVNYSVGI